MTETPVEHVGESPEGKKTDHPAHANPSISRRAVLLALMLMFAPKVQAVTTTETMTEKTRVRNLLSLIFETQDQKTLERVETDFWQAVENGRKNRPENLHKRDVDDAGLWERETVLFVTYPDMVVTKDKVTGFAALRLMFPYFESLAGNGRNVLLHILPAFKSPMKDAGFDVSDYKQMRDDLGGNAEFDAFIHEANERGIRIMLDFITNHTSDQHPWFRKALAGEKKFQDYYIFSDTDPVHKKFKTEDGNFVEYKFKLANGTETNITERIIFPDFNESVFSPVTFKTGRQAFYHHVFYKEQPDLNWFNPDVLAEFYDVMAYYANKGVSMLRLDAIPFLDKRRESHQRTIEINELLNLYLKLVAPGVRVVVEACQPPDDIVKYFGKDDGAGTTGSRVGYDFYGLPYWWLALPTAKKEHVIQPYNRMLGLMPKNASLIRFLRVHDEFTMEKVDEPVREILRKAYLHEGQTLPFRGGWNDALGISGRLANFVGNSPEKITLLYSLIMSLPGLPLIYLGDDIAAQNNYGYMEHAEKTTGVRDTRNLGRGQLKYEDFKAAQDGNGGLSASVHSSLKSMLHARFRRKSMTQGGLDFVDSDRDDVVTFRRKDGDEQTLVAINLSDTANVVNLRGQFPKAGWKDLLTDKNVHVDQTDSEIALKLAPYECRWLAPG